jgi:hypothetical protein
MQGFGRMVGTLGLVGAALVAVLMLPGLVAPASAAPVATSGAAVETWAYGAEKWVNVTYDLGNASYSAQAFFGWQVVYTATNTSATTVELEAQRTMAGSYVAQLCAPSCANPSTGQGNLSITGWEKDVGFANLTTTAQVTVNGSSQPAVGLANASTQVSGNLTEKLGFMYTAGNVTIAASSALFVQGAAHASVAFAPALGLVPDAPTAGETWNSSAAFSASGGWSVQANYYHTSIFGITSSAAFSPSGSVQASGDVTLMGGDLGTVTLNNGATVPVIVLAWTGPFDDVDGVLLVPHDFDLFANSDHSWSADALGGQTVATASLDLTIDAAHHLRVVAAASTFATTDSSLAPQGMPASGPQAPATTTTPTTVQAQPESVDQAQQNSGCLLGACPGPVGAASSSGIGAVLVIGLVLALVVGTVSVIEYRLWARKRTERGIVGSSSPLRPASPPPGASDGYATLPPPPPPSAGTSPPPPPRST